ncbi:MAG: hypothetical protein LQ337_006255 [Flavoplaca oasis]|nr:MAG: hypothetical protein LQ337_006255 [Flavoplaca oasis]
MPPVRLANNRFTHFLRIPYATAESTPQIVSAVERLAKDPIAAALPRQAWLAPGQFHHNLGSLSLRTPGHVETALRILNDLKSSYSAAFGANGRLSEKDIIYSADIVEDHLHNPKNGLLQRSRPPAIVMQGLHRDEYFPIMKSFRCYVKEPEPFLQPFRSMMIDAFSQAGLMPTTPKQGSCDITQKMMDLTYTRTDIPKAESKTPEGISDHYPPKFDASHLLPKYEDFRWTEKFSLEKLCISKLGLQDLYRKETLIGEVYRDIACIPLPGVSVADVCAGHPHDRYEKAVKTMWRKAPITPLLIPSMPFT